MKNYELQQDGEGYIVVLFCMEITLQVVRTISFISNSTSFSLFVHIA